MKELIERIIREIGEDPSREGLKETPERTEKAFKYLTSGYRLDPRDVLRRALFTEEYDEMVIVKDIDIFSLCEHHILPFLGKCHVAYLPKKKIVGLSKIVRVVEIYSRRLQVQERLTQEVASAIQETLEPHGTAVIIEAYHLCMMMRGVEKQHAKAVTSAMLGVFRSRHATRMELLDLLRSGDSLLR
jgi:GTP cyclohydrolase I